MDIKKIIMIEYSLPYNKTALNIQIEEKHKVDLFLPRNHGIELSEIELLSTAIRNPIDFPYSDKFWGKGHKVAITINDKTRPVPNNKIFPPLLNLLGEVGVKKEDITIIIATGTHLPMPENEHCLLLRKELSSCYKMVSHDCDDEKNLVFKGKTRYGTPVYVNSIFDQAAIKIVVGNIEPHHFAGFSGGVKSASIGVCGRKTINHNHALLRDPHSSVGRYEDNPLRQDIEEIGRLIGVDLALNVILNEQKDILHALWGNPEAVMLKGIQLIRENDLINIKEPYDLVIASAGGYPKDINLYQSQKALTHASLFCKKGGNVILTAACSEGVGSQSYVDFMKGVTSHEEAKRKFDNLGFTVGPHKSYQFAQISEKVHFEIKSEIDQSTMSDLLIQPVENLQDRVDQLLSFLPDNAKIAIIPFATATIPNIEGG